MSSSVSVYFRELVEIEEFIDFCNSLGIKYSPMTIGGNCFVKNDVEVIVDQMCSNGESRSEPPSEFKGLTVKTTWLGNLEGVFGIVVGLVNRWDTRIEYDPEFNHLFLRSSAENVRIFDESRDAEYLPFANT